MKERELAVEEFSKKEMMTRLFKIPVLLNGIYYVKALFNGGSASYRLINKSIT